MEFNENYQLTKAMQHYACQPLVKELERLRAENEALRVMVSKLDHSISGDFFREYERLLNEHSAMRDIMRDAIKLMRATGESSGWHQVANVAESLVNSKFTTGQESQSNKAEL